MDDNSTIVSVEIIVDSSVTLKENYSLDGYTRNVKERIKLVDSYGENFKFIRLKRKRTCDYDSRTCESLDKSTTPSHSEKTSVLHQQETLCHITVEECLDGEKDNVKTNKEETHFSVEQVSTSEAKDNLGHTVCLGINTGDESASQVQLVNGSCFDYSTDTVSDNDGSSSGFFSDDEMERDEISERSRYLTPRRRKSSRLSLNRNKGIQNQPGNNVYCLETDLICRNVMDYILDKVECQDKHIEPNTQNASPYITTETKPDIKLICNDKIISSPSNMDTFSSVHDKEPKTAKVRDKIKTITTDIKHSSNPCNRTHDKRSRHSSSTSLRKKISSRKEQKSCVDSQISSKSKDLTNEIKDKSLLENGDELEPGEIRSEDEKIRDDSRHHKRYSTKRYSPRIARSNYESSRSNSHYHSSRYPYRRCYTSYLSSRIRSSYIPSYRSPEWSKYTRSDSREPIDLRHRLETRNRPETRERPEYALPPRELSPFRNRRERSDNQPPPRERPRHISEARTRSEFLLPPRERSPISRDCTDYLPPPRMVKDDNFATSKPSSVVYRKRPDEPVSEYIMRYRNSERRYECPLESQSHLRPYPSERGRKYDSESKHEPRIYDRYDRFGHIETAKADTKRYESEDDKYEDLKITCTFPSCEDGSEKSSSKKKVKSMIQRKEPSSSSSETDTESNLTEKKEDQVKYYILKDDRHHDSERKEKNICDESSTDPCKTLAQGGRPRELTEDEKDKQVRSILSSILNYIKLDDDRLHDSSEASEADDNRMQDSPETSKTGDKRIQDSSDSSSETSESDESSDDNQSSTEKKPYMKCFDFLRNTAFKKAVRHSEENYEKYAKRKFLFEDELVEQLKRNFERYLYSVYDVTTSNSPLPRFVSESVMIEAIVSTWKDPHMVASLERQFREFDNVIGHVGYNIPCYWCEVVFSEGKFLRAFPVLDPIGHRDDTMYCQTDGR